MEQDIKPEINTSSHVTIKVQMQNDLGEVIFRVNRNVMLREVMDSFCLKMGYDFGTIRFTFDGARITPHQTPHQLGFEDGDEIDAWGEITGGFVAT
ncbi:hypothetical protein F8388_022169 [Cannabis sativa]|uniref:Ubiquitin-like domain-containing protein n=1 Tax=Cannabis sativa TaxID=3483 RepID=A0A7J6I450_CANSA|nr:hypothetical protein F8388_022169 [Cannabis sativa]KAF4401430.1 hypothetical protein G4B88_001624 [Cannabis sativa]